MRWLTAVNDKNKARCKLCLKDIDIGNKDAELKSVSDQLEAACLRLQNC